MKSMNYPRYGCVVSSIDNYIYALGGISCLNSKQMVKQIEFYNPIHNKWYLVDDKLNLNIYKGASVNV